MSQGREERRTETWEWRPAPKVSACCPSYGDHRSFVIDPTPTSVNCYLSRGTSCAWSNHQRKRVYFFLGSSLGDCYMTRNDRPPVSRPSSPPHDGMSEFISDVPDPFPPRSFRRR